MTNRMRGKKRMLIVKRRLGRRMTNRMRGCFSLLVAYMLIC